MGLGACQGEVGSRARGGMPAPSLCGWLQSKWTELDPSCLSPQPWMAALHHREASPCHLLAGGLAVSDVDKGPRPVPMSLCLPMQSVGVLHLPTQNDVSESGTGNQLCTRNRSDMLFSA